MLRVEYDIRTVKTLSSFILWLKNDLISNISDIFFFQVNCERHTI